MISNGESFHVRRRFLDWSCLVFLALPGMLQAQDAAKIERPGPPSAEDFETDEDRDDLPDGWYNIRDGRLVDGGQVGERCLRFENEAPGRPSRASRAFGTDGRAHGALDLGLWIRVDNILPGERVDEQPSLILNFFDEELRPVATRTIGPWTPRAIGSGWVKIRHRIPFPESARDAILTLGLLGATGTLDVDGMTFELVPREGVPSTNLLINGGFELGDPQPDGWELGGSARRTFPGRESDSALELNATGDRAEAGLGIPLQRITSLEIRFNARGTSLRGTAAAFAELVFLDRSGQPLAGARGSAPVARWGGSFDWRPFRATIPVPPGTLWGVFRIRKLDSAGRLVLDDVEVRATEGSRPLTWTPYRIAEDTSSWPAYEAVDSIQAGSALDASFLLKAPAGSSGRVVAEKGRLRFEDGGPARFFGVSLLPPLAFATNDRADVLAERLARSGVNLVRLPGLDTPIGPGLGLFDDSRDDTRAFDPTALARFDHLIAALKSRGIHVALELQSHRRFRSGDGLEGFRGLPPGGGAAAGFDPGIGERAMETARAWLGHVNPETGLALRDDPVLAWVTLAGELSIFDLIDAPNALPAEFDQVLREAIQRGRLGSGQRAWQALEASQWRSHAQALRTFGLNVPIAGSSHWRREPEFIAAQSISELGLIDDRLYWAPRRWAPPDRRSILWDRGSPLITEANKKIRADRPYVVGEWASHTAGAWALPTEGADLIQFASQAALNRWDAIVRRGVALHPRVWGQAAPGTGGGTDQIVVPEAINGMPPVLALLPHAASIYLRSSDTRPRLRQTGGSLGVETNSTSALAGWVEGRTLVTNSLELETFSEFAVLAVTAVGDAPLSEARRLLVTLVGRAFPKGIQWADHWRREVADPGQPPMLMEPVRGRVTWRGVNSSRVKAYALKNDGSRLGLVDADVLPNGAVRVRLDGGATCHWELVVADE